MTSCAVRNIETPTSRLKTGRITVDPTVSKQRVLPKARRGSAVKTTVSLMKQPRHRCRYQSQIFQGSAEAQSALSPEVKNVSVLSKCTLLQSMT